MVGISEAGRRREHVCGTTEKVFRINEAVWKA